MSLFDLIFSQKAALPKVRDFPLHPDRDSVNFYSAYFHCRNCEMMHERQIRKGVRRLSVKIKCPNCGFTARPA